MIKQEAKFQTLFSHWLRSVYLPKQKFFAGAFELKHHRGRGYLPFREVQEHQINALQAVLSDSKGFYHKLPDDTIGFKPYDCFALKNCPSYIVIMYKEFFVLIDINTFILEKKRSKSKSLSANRSKEIANLIVHI